MLTTPAAATRSHRRLPVNAPESHRAGQKWQQPRAGPNGLYLNSMLRPIAFSVLIGLPLATLGATPMPQEPAPQATEAQQPASESPPEGEPAAASSAEDDNLLDKTRREVRYGTEWVVRYIDGWFGDKPFEEGGKLAGRIGLRTTWRQDQGIDWLTRFAIRVDPPNLREKAYLFIGRDNEKEVVSDRPEPFTRRQQLLPETRDEQSFFAGLGAQLADAVSLRAGFRGGPKPYAQARYLKFWEFSDRSQLEFRQTLFWTLDDGLGSTASFVYDRLVGPSLTLRWQSAATWTQDNVGVQWGSTAGAYRSFGFQRQLSVEGLVNGQSGIDIGVTEYGIRTRWEQPLYRDWLLIEVIVGYFWPQTSEFTSRTTAWAFGAGVQMRF